MLRHPALVTSLIAFALGAHSAGFDGVARADDGENLRVAHPDVRERARKLFDEVVKSRERLRTCSYKANSVRTLEDHRKVDRAALVEEVLGVLDVPTGRWRFDVQQPGESNGGSGRFVRTPVEAWLYTESLDGDRPSSTLRHLPADKLPPGTQFRVVDVRTIGWNLTQDLDRGTSFEALADVYTREPTAVRGLVEEPNGITRIDYRADKNGFVGISLWIDEARALPVRVEMRYWNNEKEVWGPVESSTETEWEMRSKTWVPKRQVGRDLSRRRDGSTWTVNLEITFTWNSVNATVEDVVFDPIKGLTPIDGTDVFDLRAGFDKPVLVRTIGSER